MRRRLLIYSFLIIVISAVASYWLTHQPLPKLTPVTRPVIAVKKPVTVATFNKTQYSIDDPNSIWIVVNKQRQLQPQNFAPSDLVKPNVAKRDSGMVLRQITANAIEKLFAAAVKNGTPLKLASAYRSYDYQVNLYNGYVAKQGQTQADTLSARPGYSEHQTGLAADVSPLDGTCNLQACFGDTPAGQWLAVHAYEYGFIIRYQADITPITGYAAEPWHIRYIGMPLATEMHRANVRTLEQFFNLAAAPDYN